MNNEHQKLAEIRKLAEGLMEEHGLFGWTFKFTPAVRQYGRCTHTTKTIGISKKLGLLNELSHTKNTILHEIAHALV